LTTEGNNNTKITISVPIKNSSELIEEIKEVSEKIQQITTFTFILIHFNSSYVCVGNHKLGK